MLAAYRAGITTVLLPADNKAQLEGLAPDVLSAIWFVFVDTTMQALEALFPLREAGALASVGGMRAVPSGGGEGVGDAHCVPLPLCVDCCEDCDGGTSLPVTTQRGARRRLLRSKL